MKIYDVVCFFGGITYFTIPFIILWIIYEPVGSLGYKVLYSTLTIFLFCLLTGILYNHKSD